MSGSPGSEYPLLSWQSVTVASVAARWALGRLGPPVLAEGQGACWGCWPGWLVADLRGGP
jgi:hypothetical protein